MNAYNHGEVAVNGQTAKALEIACREFETKLNVDWVSYSVTNESHF